MKSYATIHLFHNEGGAGTTHGDEASVSSRGTYKGMVTYVQPCGSANLLSLPMVRRHGARVSFNDDSDEYTVTYLNGETQLFTSRDDLGGICVYTPTRVFVNFTAKDKMKLYTKREQRKAIEARMLLPYMGFSFDKDYAGIMPVTSADVYRAHRIFGKDVPSIWGRRASPRLT